MAACPPAKTVGATDWVPTKEFNNVWDFVQNVALSKGAHAYKFGFEFRSIKFPFFQVPDPHGIIGFSNNETAFPSGNNASNGSSISSLTGDAMASALLGVVDSGAISTTNFVFVAARSLCRLRPGRLESKLETDVEPRRPL
jgi:hypothetical protein